MEEEEEEHIEGCGRPLGKFPSIVYYGAIRKTFTSVVVVYAWKDIKLIVNKDLHDIDKTG